MARKPRKSQTSRRQASGNPRERLLDAALALLVEHGWRSVSVNDIAKAAGVDAAEATRLYPSKTAILGEFLDRLDRVTAEGGADGGSVRERLFDLLMLRFDALQAQKPAVKAFAEGLCTSPLTALTVLPRFLKSMARLLETTGVGTTGPLGLIRIKGLSAVYGNAFRVWLKDDSPDMGRTMAALDRGLAQAETLAKLCPARLMERSNP